MPLITVSPLTTSFIPEPLRWDTASALAGIGSWANESPPRCRQAWLRATATTPISSDFMAANSDFEFYNGEIMTGNDATPLLRYVMEHDEVPVQERLIRRMVADEFDELCL
ncbi:uncharacterized protein BCR38DRAFT_509396 [Pseudomassariella vexata]|uniref:Uncharacterized protein n=1 Tax=Pseudomassariella vexata TaxID=1141098 RepID=A0A1Y2E848_9PEZI|nr:uncharacterized protein BCR38DRAFT_509396 [Pseudomassariella vexata]ORY67025.1 hypothetical protein BCR38DRAFT_509396 [Pseudomassariella vexata]